jgi:hypothetical protein
MRTEEEVKERLEKLRKERNVITNELDSMKAWTDDDWKRVQLLFGNRSDLSIQIGILRWVLDDKLD